MYILVMKKIKLWYHVLIHASEKGYTVSRSLNIEIQVILVKVKITSNLSLQKKYLEKSNSVKIQLYQDETVIRQENLLYVLRHLRKETISLNIY